ncbi:MAG: hypothetical protein C0490_03380 [Marivirga sp.]|nr:hypothetical protein [Marivirga sp.]
MTDQVDVQYSSPASLEVSAAKKFTSLIVRWSWFLFGIFSVYQFIFFPDLTNAMMVACVGFAWLILTKLFLKQEMLRNFPFSSFLIFGFTSTQFYFPLVFTSLEGKPLIYNLELPEQVFLHSTSALLVLTVSHAFYRLVSKLSYRRSYSVLTKTGFFTPPTDIQLWIMGFIGIAASYYVFFTAPDVGWEVTGAASDKLVQGLIPFSYAPFFIPFGLLYGRSGPTSKRLTPMLLAYMLILFGISIGRNSTGGFMLGFTAVGFSYFLGLLLGIFQPRFFTLKNVLIGAFGIWLLVGPLADLRTAMVLVRGDRLEMSAEELLPLTLEAFNDKEAINMRRLEDNTQGVDTDWDERYLDNVFTARFANIKFNDNSLVRAEVVKKYDPDMLEYSIDYILGGLPDPFLKALNLDVDKEFVYSLSIGDYLYLAAGGYGYVSGFRSGHFAGTGMATFGWWYLFILGIGMIPVFFLFDKFSKKKSIDFTSEKSGTKQLQFSFCGLLALFSVFQFMPSESVITIATFLMRGWIQMALLYFFVFHFTRLINGKGLKRIKFR